MFNRTLVSDDIAEWILDQFPDRIESCGLTEAFKNARLVLPTEKYFRPITGTDHQAALSLFEDVKLLMGLEHRNIHLHRLYDTTEGVETIQYGVLSEIAGTYMYDKVQPVISYAPATQRLSTLNFIATLAHELAHDWMYNVGFDEEDMTHELQTDLIPIIVGFGLIIPLGAREIGWSGYLSNEARIFALATFMAIKDLPIEVIRPFLDGNLKKKLTMAQKQLTTYSDDIAELRASLLG